MPIEFRCTECDKLLRTPDEAAGKKAKCPHCDAIVDVPLSSPAEGAGAPPPPAGGLTPPPPVNNPYGEAATGGLGGAKTDTFNPYASPSAAAGMKEQQAASGTLQHRTVAFDEVLSKTWGVFHDQLGQCLMAGLVGAAIVLGMVVVFGGIGIGVQIALMPVNPAFGAIFPSILMQVLALPVQTWMNLAFISMMIHFARTGEISFGSLAAAGKFMMRGLGFYGIFVAVSVVTHLPGIFLALIGSMELALLANSLSGFADLAITFPLAIFFFLAVQFVVDRDLPLVEAMKMSLQFMQGNKLTTFLLMIVIGMVGMLFVCATCTVGIVALMPFGYLFQATIYLMATGQPMYEPLPRK